MKNIASNNIQQKNSRQIIFQSYKQKNQRQINFQSYIDIVKEDKISWNFFISLMRDLSHTNIDRLKTLNEILLNELKISIDEKRHKNAPEKIENFKEVYIQYDGTKKVEPNYENVENKIGHFNKNITENDEDENRAEQHFEKNVEHISHKFQKNLEHISHNFEKNLVHIYENIQEDDQEVVHNSNENMLNIEEKPPNSHLLKSPA